MSQKHPNIINISEVEPRIESKGDKFGFKGCRLGPKVGVKSIGTSYFEIDPGLQAFPNHFHSANEEAVYVLEGSGHVRIGNEKIAIKAGDYIAFPPGPEFSHSLHNTSNAVLKLLCISTLASVEIVGYPDSKKFGVVAMQDGKPWVRMIIKDQPSLDYYDGEI